MLTPFPMEPAREQSTGATAGEDSPLADDVSVLLSIFLSRPQNLLAIGHPLSKLYRRASRTSLLLGQAWEWLAGGDACVIFGGSLRCRLRQAHPWGRRTVGH